MNTLYLVCLITVEEQTDRGYREKTEAKMGPNSAKEAWDGMKGPTGTPNCLPKMQRFWSFYKTDVLYSCFRQSAVHWFEVGRA